MAFLTVAGVDIPVAADGASFGERHRVGSLSRAYDGTMRTTIRATKIIFKVRTTLIDDAKLAAIRSAVLMGARLAITGDMGGYYAIGTLGEVRMMWQGGARKYIAELTLEEV